MQNIIAKQMDMIAKTMQWDQSYNKLEFSLKIKKHAVPQSLNVWSVMHVYLGELEYEYLEGKGEY